jgi:hypothetical protein
MILKRCLLAVGGLGVVVSAPHRVGASGPVDLEGTAYGGVEEGEWACGPRARARYGGVGGEVRAHPFRADLAAARAADKGAAEDQGAATGPVFAAAGSVEHKAFEQIDCSSDSSSDACGKAVPPAGLSGAGRAIGGYDWEYFGLSAGVIVWTHYDSPNDAHPTPFLFPDLALRFGPTTRWRISAGLGSYNVPTLLRPGLYGGVGFSPSLGWDLDLHGGAHFGFAEQAGVRADAALRIPIAPRLQLGLGTAVSNYTSSYIDPEGRIFLAGRL